MGLLGTWIESLLEEQRLDKSEPLRQFETLFQSWCLALKSPAKIEGSPVLRIFEKKDLAWLRVAEGEI